eukprot:2195387-Rhodomonas_salina.1
MFSLVGGSRVRGAEQEGQEEEEKVQAVINQAQHKLLGFDGSESSEPKLSTVVDWSGAASPWHAYMSQPLALNKQKRFRSASQATTELSAFSSWSRSRWVWERSRHSRQCAGRHENKLPKCLRACRSACHHVFVCLLPSTRTVSAATPGSRVGKGKLPNQTQDNAVISHWHKARGLRFSDLTSGCVLVVRRRPEPRRLASGRGSVRLRGERP